MKKKLFNVLFFFMVMGLTAVVIYRNHDIGQVMTAVHSANKLWLVPAALSAFLFVFCECVMIRGLLRLLGHKVGLLRCLSYSFIGYFYSGITPSASGGQPMQLYYMQKDGNGLSDSSFVLLTVAFFSRLVLSVIGVALLLFCHGMLTEYFQGYFFVYWLGLILNTLIAAAIFAVMALPQLVRRVAGYAERLMVRLHVIKRSEERLEKMEEIIDGYQGAVRFMARHRKKAVQLFCFTFFQRVTLYVLTWFVYRSFGLGTDSFWRVVLLQAAIYVSVEMLPLPGSQGITELLYHNIFGAVFGAMLTPSMLVVRGLDFYMLMIIGAVFSALRFFRVRKAEPRGKDAAEPCRKNS
jgi:uncharacterized protein (TIRG00374 family)